MSASFKYYSSMSAGSEGKEGRSFEEGALSSKYGMRKVCLQTFRNNRIR